ncbi:Monoterpene epsilon-lactone hydrolase [Roseivivax jejudonensis]|uniref:Monoterpene epsilon-lactone hydrolase n=1 Tax=Roseivivax jejudonensis TaxID=1529041 RepID=A0A1X6Y9F5_9RHOB|nr:alpha/beta hydrolase [Roseivivax jejudonensis]SLN14540.1 Monoterpene epsilon-lactone hydrolase [Roseivivax jejudonensis]
MSWQAKLLGMHMRAVVKPWLARIDSPGDFAADVGRFNLLLRRPPFLRRFSRPDGLTWLSAGETAEGLAILYFHGGAYVAGSPDNYSGPLGQLSFLSGIEVCAPRYRLAPAAPFPAAYHDAKRAWRKLRRLGFAPEDIVIGGDSAGGGLALALLSKLCRRGTPPRAAFAFSPWTDLAMTGDSLRENRDTEAMLPAERMADVVDLYLGTHRRTDPRASPLYAAFPNCPPVLLQYGETEILRDDSRRMADRLRGYGAPVTEEVVPDVPHVWQILDGWLPEARASLESTARFVQDSFATPTSR